MLKNHFAILSVIIVVSAFIASKKAVSYEATRETPSFQYHDKETGCEFDVPANWSMTSLSKERKYWDVKFTSNAVPELNILYGSTDLWAQLSTSEKKGLSRADLNNSFFSSTELAESLRNEGYIMSVVEYNELEYYKLISSSKVSVYGIDFGVSTTCLIRIENGYIYSFQFSSHSHNELYKDFEALIKSIHYPIVEPSKLGKINYKVICFILIGIALCSFLPGFISQKKGRSFWGYYFLSFVITPIISTIILLFQDDKLLAEKCTFTDTAYTKTILASENPRPRTRKYCRYCGNILGKDKTTCQNCGAQLKRD